jgi:hypothetical protein
MLLIDGICLAVYRINGYGLPGNQGSGWFFGLGCGRETRDHGHRADHGDMHTVSSAAQAVSERAEEPRGYLIGNDRHHRKNSSSPRILQGIRLSMP